MKGASPLKHHQGTEAGQQKNIEFARGKKLQNNTLILQKNNTA
jgi:hypothetical protein